MSELPNPTPPAADATIPVEIPTRETQLQIAVVVHALEEDIVFGRLHQRERLIEDDLKKRFLVKRHIIRAALTELGHMGLVELIPNRGASVRAYSAEMVNHLYVVRELLETHAARLIPLPLPPEDLDKLIEVERVHSHAVETNDLRVAFRSNIKFHRTLFALCGNPVLAQEIDKFAYRTHGIRFYSLTNPVYLRLARDDHHKMINALEVGAREELVELCRKHILPAKELYLQSTVQHLV